MLDRIDRRMPEFNEMSPAARRVAIARDVLMQLDARKLFPRAGAYVTVVPANAAGFFPVVDEERCYVCALGAIAISVFDGKAVEEYSDNQSMYRIHRALGAYFEHPQLDLIEAAFEGWEHSGWEFGAGDLLSSETCLRGIMENIVRNDGTFVPAQISWAEHLYDDDDEDEDPPPGNGGHL